MASDPDLPPPAMGPRGPGEPARPRRPDSPELANPLGNLHWSQPEVAWPIAMLAGFGGIWLGIETGLPGLGPGVAAIAFTPLFVLLLRRRRGRLAGILMLGWCVGVAAGAVGGVIQDGFPTVADALPGARWWQRTEVEPWLVGERPADPGLRVGRNAIAVVVLLVLARPTLGLASIAALALGASAVGAAVGRFAERASADGGEPALWALSAVPPHYALAVVGLGLATAALAQPEPLRPFAELSDRRRRMLVGGTAAALAGVVSEPVVAPVWGGWLATALG